MKMDGEEEDYEKAGSSESNEGGKASMELVSKGYEDNSTQAAFQGLILTHRSCQTPAQRTARPLGLDDARESRLILVILVQLQLQDPGTTPAIPQHYLYTLQCLATSEPSEEGGLQGLGTEFLYEEKLWGAARHNRGN